MLLLTRNQNEKIIIGKDICIEVLGTRGCAVRIGITAPRSVSIVRTEIMGKYTDTELKKRHEAKQTKLSPESLDKSVENSESYWRHPTELLKKYPAIKYKKSFKHLET